MKKAKPAVQRTKGSSSSEASSVSPIIHRLKEKPVDQTAEKDSTNEESAEKSTETAMPEEKDQPEKENEQPEGSILENISNSSSPQKSGEPTDITSKFSIQHRIKTFKNPLEHS